METLRKNEERLSVFIKTRRREAYHPSAVAGGTSGSGSFAVILSQ